MPLRFVSGFFHRAQRKANGSGRKYVRGLGLGVPTKPKYDPIEIGRQMDDAISEFFEGDKQLPGQGKGRALLAERMGLNS
jgi:hypothetical protein